MEARSIPRMRTAQQACDEIHALDPNSGLTVYRIKCMIRSGQLPHVKAGKKYLVNLDTLYDLLESGQVLELGPQEFTPGLRVVPERM